MRRHLISLLAVLVLALVAGGCGGDDKPSGGGSSGQRPGASAEATAAVRRAGAVTERAGSAQVTIDSRVRSGGQDLPQRGSGAFDFRTDAGRFRINLSMPGVNGPVDAIFRGSTYYIKLDQLASQLPGGKRWIKLDVAQLARQGVDAGQLQSFGGGDPTVYLQYLATGARDVREVGPAQVDGVPTRHYRATVDLPAVIRDGTAAQRRSAQVLRRQFGTDRVPVDLWLDRAGRVRRHSARVEGQGQQVSFTIDFPRFGVPVDATPPPARETLDFGQLAALSGGGGGRG